VGAGPGFSGHWYFDKRARFYEILQCMVQGNFRDADDGMVLAESKVRFGLFKVVSWEKNI
jgi:hypothetical protein